MSSVQFLAEREGHQVKSRPNPYRGLLWGCLISSALWAVLVMVWITAGHWIGGIF